MPARLEHTPTPPSPRISIAIWIAAGALLLLPFIAMYFTHEVTWSASDFMVFGVMLLAACGSYEVVARKGEGMAYRAGAGLALAGMFLLVWVNLAVGIIGSEHDAANLLFLGVLATGIAGAGSARFRASGMARTLIAMTTAQVLVAVVALLGGMGRGGPIWPRDLLGATATFTGIWLAAGWLFHRAAAFAK